VGLKERVSNPRGKVGYSDLPLRKEEVQTVHFSEDDTVKAREKENAQQHVCH